MDIVLMKLVTKIMSTDVVVGADMNMVRERKWGGREEDVWMRYGKREKFYK
jgi:hypothetical protein